MPGIIGCELLSGQEKLAGIKSGEMEARYFIFNEFGKFFHMWPKADYGEPQFGDLYSAKAYKSLAAAKSRLRALQADGYRVITIKILVKGFK